MNVYFYAKSGHTVGLEATKRCASVAHYLKDFDPILCTSDFRAGAFAKDNLEVKKYVNIDVMRNLHNIMKKRDILIYDSPEAGIEMKKDLETFCTISFDLNENPNDIFVDTMIYTKNDNPTIEKAVFYGDDDYGNHFLKAVENLDLKSDCQLLMGHYFFLGNESIFENKFQSAIDEEEYVQTIQNSKYLLTGSQQTAFESISCGNNPVILIRNDKEYNFDLINSLNIPTIKYSNLKDNLVEFENITKNYPSLNELNVVNLESLKDEISAKIELFNKLIN